MALYTIKDETLTEIADVIREKQGIIPITSGILAGGQDWGNFEPVLNNLTPGGIYKLIITPTYVSKGAEGSFYAGGNVSGVKISDKVIFEEGITQEFILSLPEDADDINYYWVQNKGYQLKGTYTLEEIDENGNSVYAIKPTEMANAISEMSVIPESIFNLTGDCHHMFRNNKWNWLIEQYGDKITTNQLRSVDYMFYGSSNLTEIPFALNLELSGSTAKQTILQDTFYQVKLQKFPQINITGYGTSNRPIILERSVNPEPNITLGDTINLVGFTYDAFQYYKGEEEPGWIFEKCDWEVARNDTSTFGTSIPVSWTGAYYIKTIPSMPKFYTFGTSLYYSHWYQFNVNECYNLKEITLPRPGSFALTSSPSGFSPRNVNTLKHFVFDIQEDGTPYTANWKNLTLSLYNLGYGINSSYLSSNKLVSNDEKYLLLKDDDEYWAQTAEYSGYNHDSAVETINSLPDTSAYGTNIIKFKGISGSKTDGGAINTLTEEEIAVATAKGWTVSLV